MKKFISITFLGLQLTDESGPAHKKSFTVCLLVGDEEYNASGPSIKKAQHAAAAIALEKTKLKHPPPTLNCRGSRYQNSAVSRQIISISKQNSLAKQVTRRMVTRSLHLGRA